jgi:thiol-disulfide isomerase/thioredoxin
MCAAFTLVALLCTFSGSVAQNVPGILMDFSFTRPNGKPLLKSDLAAGKPTVVILFSPTCDHCQAQAKMIDAKINDFAKAQFVWVTFDDDAAGVNAFPLKYMPNWSKTNKTAPAMHWGLDKKFQFDNFFGESQVPTVLIYDGKGTLKKRFTKEQTAEELLKYIQ